MSTTQITPADIAEHLAQGPLGASEPLWTDVMPYVVVGATATGKTITVVPLQTVNLTTGHQADHHVNGFPVWDHRYTAHEMQEGSPLRVEGVERKARWSDQRGRYLLNGRPIVVGVARYRRDYSD